MATRTFGSLGYRNYRLLWIGTFISQTGEWMDSIALNWMVLEMTDSALYLGLVNLAKAGPVLIFTLMGGVAADRMERRRLVMISQGAAMVLAFALAILASTHTVQLWHAFVITSLRGLLMSFNLPARQALISELVPRDSLANAVALHSFNIQITRVLGPAVAGVLIATAGVAGSFYANAAGFLVALFLIQAIQVTSRAECRPGSSFSGSLFEGIRFISRTRTIFWLVLVGLLPAFFAQPYMSLLTVFARDVLSIGATGLGLLTSTAAAGSAIGGLVLVSLGNSGQRGWVTLSAVMTLGVTLILFSFSQSLHVSLPLLLLAGSMSAFHQASSSTLLQLSVPDEVRGRIVSTLYLARGIVPMGVSLAGFLSMFIGIQWAMAGMASIVVLLGLGVSLFVPQVRRLRPLSAST
ncbi:MAG: MFS transporter [Actinobacteria bacterium]|nr:MFS transporter [Actinomycetota bacterium]